MPEQCQIQNASVVQTRQQSHQMGLGRKFMGKGHWMWAWKSSEDSDKQKRGHMLPVQIPRNPILPFHASAVPALFRILHIYQSKTQVIHKTITWPLFRGPCLQLVLFERNLAKFYHGRIPPAKLTACKSCLWACCISLESQLRWAMVNRD